MCTGIKCLSSLMCRLMSKTTVLWKTTGGYLAGIEYTTWLEHWCPSRYIECVKMCAINFEFALICTYRVWECPTPKSNSSSSSLQSLRSTIDDPLFLSQDHTNPSAGDLVDRRGDPLQLTT